MAKKSNVEKNIEMETENAVMEPAPKQRMIKGKLVTIIDKTPEERKAAFIANVNHESDRVHEWSEKLLTHTCSTVYPLTDKAIDAIVARYNDDHAAFIRGIEKFRTKGTDKTIEKVGLISVADVL